MDDAFTDDLIVRLATLGELRARRMFGGVGLYCDDLFFGLLDAGVLYFKVDEGTRAEYVAAGASPFQPFPGEMPVGGYYEVPLGVQERDEELRAWAARAIEVARRAKSAKKKPTRGRSRRTEPAPVPLSKLPNLGPQSCAWLRAAGIRTRAELERLGSVEAYRRVAAAAGAEVSLNLLYALEGALLDLRWDRLSPAVKANLRERLERR